MTADLPAGLPRVRIESRTDGKGNTWASHVNDDDLAASVDARINARLRALADEVQGKNRFGQHAAISPQDIRRFANAAQPAAPAAPSARQEAGDGSLFRKKPIVIEAVQFRAGMQDGRFAQDVIDGRVRYPEDGTMLIQTLEGVMSAQSGDWIIRGVKGELYPCKPDIFAASYEPATPPAAPAAPAPSGVDVARAAIREACIAVENCGADTRLTEAVQFLSHADMRVAHFGSGKYVEPLNIIVAKGAWDEQSNALAETRGEQEALRQDIRDCLAAVGASFDKAEHYDRAHALIADAWASLTDERDEARAEVARSHAAGFREGVEAARDLMLSLPKCTPEYIAQSMDMLRPPAPAAAREADLLPGLLSVREFLKEHGDDPGLTVRVFCTWLNAQIARLSRAEGQP